MKSITHTIASQDDIESFIETFNLKPAASLQTISASLMELASHEDIPIVYIKVHESILPLSYHKIPAMLARSMLAVSVYPSIQSYREGKFVVVRAGESKRPISFSARAIAAIRKNGKFKSTKLDTPYTYRKHPTTLAHILYRETGYSIATVAKPNLLIWKTTQKQLP